MALPIIQTGFTHSMTLPGNVNLNYRPFTGKEEKVLLLSIESNDSISLAKAILDVTNACVENFTFNDQPLYYTEYALSQIRGKSVGEDQELQVLCKKCEHPHKITADLEAIKFSGEPRTGEAATIEVADNIHIGLRELTLGDVLKNPKLINNNKEASLYYEVLDVVVDTVQTTDDIMKFSDESKADRENFLDSLSSPTHQKLREFIDGTPTAYLEVPFVCKSCGEDNKDRRLEGIENFFGS